MDTNLLTLTEVANLFHVSKSTVYRMVQSRILPFYRLGGNLRFKEDDIMAFLESQRVKPREEWFYIAKHKSHLKTKV